MARAFTDNRVVRDSGCRIPILNAPIGTFARARLAGAVSAAGGLGLLEANTAPVERMAEEVDALEAHTSAPFGMHVFARPLFGGRAAPEEMLDLALGHTRFITSGNGKPDALVPAIKAAGAVLYHQIGSVKEAVAAVDAGADGLIVEGAEAGGLRGEKALHIFSLLQQVRSRVDVPLVAAGGIVDGIGMAGAFALGAEGVVMGTRFLSAHEAPTHDNWKRAVTECETTISLDVGLKGRRMRAVRNELAEAVARGDVEANGNPYAGNAFEAFHEGRVDKALVGVGESASLITTVKSVADIIAETTTGFWQEIDRLARLGGHT